MNPSFTATLISKSSFRTLQFRSFRALRLLDYLTEAGFRERDFRFATTADYDVVWEMFWEDETKRINNMIKKMTAGN